MELSAALLRNGASVRDPETVATSAEGDTVASKSSAYIVVATGDGEHVEQWIATGTAATALMKVRQNLPPGWLVSLTGASLTLEQAAALGFDRTVKLSDKPLAGR